MTEMLVEIPKVYAVVRTGGEHIAVDRETYAKLRNSLLCTGIAPIVFLEIEDIYGKEWLVNKAQISYVKVR